MTADVNRIQGTYKIQNVDSFGVVTDILVVDTTGSSYPVVGNPTSSTVVITGNLVVVGTKTQTSSTEVTIKDPTILLNQGNTAFAAGEYLGGIKISRDSSDTDANAAFVQWNNDAVWHATGVLGQVNGLYEFRQGIPGVTPNPVFSAIKINAIRMPKFDPILGQPEGGYSYIDTIAKPRLNIFGSDNPDAVMSVKGTINYRSNVTDPDDIPNKDYVDNAIATQVTDAKNVVVGKSYITINDKLEDSASFSQIIGVLDGDPVVKPNPTTGTVVLRVTTSTALLSRMQFLDNQISPVRTNANLILSANGTGQIVASSPLLFQTGIVPTPSSGQTGLYSQNPGSGGTGMYYVNSSTGGVVTQDEFVSRKKALIFSLIF